MIKIDYSLFFISFFLFSQLAKQIETKGLSKSFGQLLYLASVSQFEYDRHICSINHCGHQQRNVLLLTNVPDLGIILIKIKSKFKSFYKF